MTSHEVNVQLIASTTMTTGLQVQAAPDTTAYPVGTKVTDQALAYLVEFS